MYKAVPCLKLALCFFYHIFATQIPKANVKKIKGQVVAAELCEKAKQIIVTPCSV